MSECTDHRLGTMLHAYELGILPDGDADAVEVHLLECEHCSELAHRQADTVHLLRTDAEVQAIAAEQTPERPQTQSPQVRKRRIPIVRITTIAAAAVLLLILRPWRLEFQTTEEAEAHLPTLAILYFNNLAEPADENRKAEIVTDLLINDLSESRHLTVVSSQRLYDVLTSLGHQGEKTVPADLAAKVAEKANARWYLTGSIVELEPAVVLSSQLVETETGHVLGSQRVVGPDDASIYSAVDSLTVAVKADLTLPEAAYAERDPAIGDITTRSDEAYAHYLAGLDHYFKYFNQDAAEEFLVALELDGTFAMAYYRLYMTGRGGKRAINNAVKYADKASDIQQRYIRAASLTYLDQYDSALYHYREICSLYVDEKEAHYLQARILSARRQRTDAIAEYRESVRIDPNFKRAYNELTTEYADENQLDSAIWAISRYIELAPDEPMPHVTRGELLARGGDPEAGIGEYEHALALKPGFSSAWPRLAGLYIQTGRHAEADTLLHMALGSEDPGTAGYARFHIPMNLKHQGRIREALQAYRETSDWLLLHRGSQSVAAWCHLFGAALYDLQLGQPDSALAEAERAAVIMAALDENDTQNMIGAMAVTHARVGRFGTADSLLETVRASLEKAPLPQEERYALFRGIIEQARGNYDSALYYLGLAATITPRFPEKLWLGRCQLEAGLVDEAILTIEGSLKSYDWLRAHWSDASVTAHYDLGRAYEAAGRARDAAEQYSVFLELWKDADAGLWMVEEAKKRLAHLNRL